MDKSRCASIERKTKETEISLTFNIDGSGVSQIDSGIPFLDHMLTLFAKHGFFDLNLKCIGDLEVDYHHSMEDIGLALGEAISKSLGDRSGIRRYGSFLLPMDEALAQVALDLSNRPYLVYDVNPPASLVSDIDVQLFHEFFQALAVKSGMNMHIDLVKAQETHHAFEAIFKGFAKALDQATQIDPRLKGDILSTKGIL